jgi:hypothetical protein
VVGQKYHVAADRDATNKLRIYRDGVMVGSVSTGAVGMPDASSNGADLGIGCDSNPASPDHGTAGSTRFALPRALRDTPATARLYGADRGIPAIIKTRTVTDYTPGAVEGLPETKKAARNRRAAKSGLKN